jgi:hypothetical protein
VNFSTIEDMDLEMLIIVAMGIIVNVIMIAVSAVASAYVAMCHGDEGMAGCVNSLSILCSLVTITGLLAFMGLY